LGDSSFFRTTADRVLGQIERIPKAIRAYGLIHADLHRFNIHYDERAGFTVYDFDHCRYGWRVADLVVIGQALQAPPFIEGYESVRPLSGAEQAAIPAFTQARDICDIGDHLAMRSVKGRRDPTNEELEEELERLRQLV
tara:strand:+ start:37922 stop:38338 length:417 start_codon:yes stop_codon:yes gene_type:complete